MPLVQYRRLRGKFLSRIEHWISWLWLWNLFLFLACLNVLNNMEYTITYFPLLLVPSLVSEWYPSLSTPPLVSPEPSFIQLYLYQLLSVTFAQRVSSRMYSTWSYSTKPNPLTGFFGVLCGQSLCQLVLVYSPFFLRGVINSVVLNLSPSHQFCDFGLENPRPLWRKDNRLVTALGWLW